jgi:hypothetical protein
MAGLAELPRDLVTLEEWTPATASELRKSILGSVATLRGWINHLSPNPEVSVLLAHSDRHSGEHVERGEQGCGGVGLPPPLRADAEALP